MKRCCWPGAAGNAVAAKRRIDTAANRLAHGVEARERRVVQQLQRPGAAVAEVLADGAPPGALGGNAYLRRLVIGEGAGKERLDLLRHRGDDGRRQLRAEPPHVRGPVAHERRPVPKQER